MRKDFTESEVEISEALPEFYVPYASYVIQTRALPDVRDGLKTGARFIIYSQYTNKITFKDKRRKGTATKSATMMFSPHGDSSIYGNAVRMSQNFSLRYPLIDTHGNNGSMMHNNDYAADRYLEMRSGEIAGEMTSLLRKETIDKWKLNYTEEEEYPTYLPTLFPNSLVNGNFGIGVSLASSIPSHNLKEVCAAIVKMIDNPNISFDEIYCPIDLPTGGTIINADEVKESHRNGKGKAAIVRATIEFDEQKRELIVTDLPYMVFSSNATAAIQTAIDDGNLIGVQKVYDGTDYDGVKIVIELSKTANVQKITKLLYKYTPLQNYVGINMNMLDEGKYPKCFNWQEMIEIFIKHIKNILEKSFNFDLRKIKKRIHILDGLLTATLHIEEVVKIIKNSVTAAAARHALMEAFEFSEEQTKAILDLKLSRLANLERQKLQNEKDSLLSDAQKIEKILSEEVLFNNEVKKEIKRISDKYGDDRKTKNINLDYKGEPEDAEPIEQKELLMHFTNFGNIYTQETTTLLSARRGGRGAKIKLLKGEFITKTITDSNCNSLLVFTNKGLMYNVSIDDLPISSRVNIAQLFNFSGGEAVTAVTSKSRNSEIEYFTFITKNGIIKKTKANEYNSRKRSIKAIVLKEDDEVVNVLFTNNNDKVGILTFDGNFVIIDTSDITSTGRATMGVAAVKLSSGNRVIDSDIVGNSDSMLLTISEGGLIKKTNISEFPICNRNTKGKKISGVKDSDSIVKFLTLDKNCDIIVILNEGMIKFSTEELRTLSRAAIGVKAVSLKENSKVVDILKA